MKRAEMEYDLALKKIALEEAQQNKSTMRLRRDANGNYSYQFGADEDNVSKAQQDVDKAQNDLYNFDKESYQQNLETQKQMTEKFYQDLAALAEKYKDDEEGYQKAKEELTAAYYEQFNYLAGENAEIRMNLEQDVGDSLGINMDNMSQTEKNTLMEDIIPTWDSGVQQMIDKFSADDGASFKTSVNEAWNSIKEATKDYNDALGEVKTTSDDVASQVEKQTADLKEQAEQEITDANEEREAIEAIKEAVDELAKSWGDAADEALRALNAAQQYMENEQEKTLTATTTKKSSGGSTTTKGKSTTTKKTTTKKTTTKATTTKKPTTTKKTLSSDKIEGIAAAIWMDGDKAGWGNGDTRAARFKEKGAESVQNYINKHGANGDIYAAWHNKRDKLPNYYYSKFDTGGYTGDWNSKDGKLAVLHEKELVLNKDDTKNLLSIVDIARNIIGSLKSNMFNNINSIADSIKSATNVQPSSSHETIEQTVHIDAKFEGATESAEIERAFDNLINKASQYANKNTK